MSSIVFSFLVALYVFLMSKFGPFFIGKIFCLRRLFGRIAFLESKFLTVFILLSGKGAKFLLS